MSLNPSNVTQVPAAPGSVCPTGGVSVDLPAATVVVCNPNNGMNNNNGNSNGMVAGDPRYYSRDGNWRGYWNHWGDWRDRYGDWFHRYTYHNWRV